MKLPVIAVLFALITCAFTSAQTADTREGKSEKKDIGKAFLLALCTKDYQTAWNVLAPSVQREHPYGMFIEMATPFAEAYETGGHPGIESYMSGSVVIDNKPHRMQQYRFANDVSTSEPTVLFEVVISDSSDLILRFRPRMRAAMPEENSRIPTSQGREDALEGGQVWIVEGDTVQVQEAAVVFFGSEAILAIKVFRSLPDDITQEQARTMAIPIVRHALNRGLGDIAQKYAEKNGVALRPSVGLAFIKPGTVRGYRVMVEASDYAP